MTKQSYEEWRAEHVQEMSKEEVMKRGLSTSDWMEEEIESIIRKEYKAYRKHSEEN